MLSSRGFTLIELLIVITLMGIFVGGGVAGYRTFNTRQLVVTGGKELLVNLRQAQSKMSSGVKSTSGCQNTPLVGYLLSGGTTQYTISEVYFANCGTPATTQHVIKTVALPTGIRFQSTFNLTFMGLSGGTTFTGASPLRIRVCNSACSAGALTYQIDINQAGLIEDKGAQ